MSATPTWVLPGIHTAVIGEKLLLLVVVRDTDDRHDRDEDWLLRLGSLTESAPTAADVLEVLSGGMLAGLPDFALALAEGPSVRVLVRGSLCVRVGDRTVTATDVSTWVETVLPVADRVELVPDAQGDAVGPCGLITVGVVAAGAVVRGHVLPEPAAVASGPAAVASGPEPDPELVREPELVPEPQPESVAVESEPTPAVADDADEFDALFGHTVMRTVEAAAVRDVPVSPTDAAAPAVPPVSPSAVVAGPPAFVSGVPGAPNSAVPPQGVPLAGPVEQPPLARRPLIDGIPGTAAVAESAAVPPSPEPSRAEAAFDPEEQTVRRVARPTGAHVAGAVVEGPTVQAVHCPNGHPNPPQAGTCRVCQASVGASNIVTIPRPQLGRLRFDGGQSVAITRPVIMGRAPKSPTTSRPEVPILFTVASPSGDISRSHLEIAIEGWHVQAIDLDSANGTTVTQPGMPPRRLHPADPVILQPGARVALSDEVVFTYEVAD